MNWIIENWYIIFGLVALVIAIVFQVIKFIEKPRAEQINALKEWLRYAVSVAEMEFGSKTGELKLHMVYDWAIERFKWLPTFVSFEKFKEYVDDALDWLDNQLQTNETINKIITK